MLAASTGGDRNRGWLGIALCNEGGLESANEGGLEWSELYVTVWITNTRAVLRFLVEILRAFSERVHGREGIGHVALA